MVAVIKFASTLRDLFDVAAEVVTDFQAMGELALVGSKHDAQ